jgi:KaiC/GvpD/RAD55 family RecA-like ATPase
MSNFIPVPPELAAFVRSPHSQTLLIRGPPGSGKTMLSFALMESFPGRRVYVSLRVDRSSLIDQFPWLAAVTPAQIDIVDAAEEADHLQEHVRMGHKELLLSHTGEARDVEEFTWLPKAVQSAWSAAGSPEPTMMVFDSWDAIIDQYFERALGEGESGPSRAEIERILIGRMMKKKNVSLVLILERDTSSVLDYIVHGIAETSRHLEEGRLERWLSLPKLRGTPIPVDTYPFTLARGRFTAITPTLSNDFTIRAPVEDPRPEDPGQWPGSTDYAAAFGRLAPSRVTLIELGSAVPREIPRVIMTPILMETIRGGGRGLLFSPPSLDPEDALFTAADLIAKHGISPRMRVMTAVPLPVGTARASGLFTPYHWTTSVPSVPVPDDVEFLAPPASPGAPNLIVVFLSGLEAAAETAGVTLGQGFLSAFAATVFPDSPVHILAFARARDPLAEKVNPIAEVLLKVRYSNGRVFLSGDRPYSAPLILSYEGGDEPYRLTPIL